jgi:hypothetical protein
MSRTAKFPENGVLSKFAARCPFGRQVTEIRTCRAVDEKAILSPAGSETGKMRNHTRKKMRLR